MRKSEKSLWATMRANNKSQDHVINLTRVENMAAEGMPDVYCRTFSSECWVELKVAKEPKRKITRVMCRDGLNLTQRNWHIKHSAYGLKSYVLLRVNMNNGCHKLFLLPSKFARDMNDFGMETLMLSSVAMTWKNIFSILRKT